MMKNFHERNSSSNKVLYVEENKRKKEFEENF